jgi:hypothetical protein
MVALGCQDISRPAQRSPHRKTRLAGLVLMRPLPSTSREVIFAPLEDEFGTANLVVWADVGAQDRESA